MERKIKVGMQVRFSADSPASYGPFAKGTVTEDRGDFGGSHLVAVLWDNGDQLPALSCNLEETPQGRRTRLLAEAGVVEGLDPEGVDNPGTDYTVPMLCIHRPSWWDQDDWNGFLGEAAWPLPVGNGVSEVLIYWNDGDGGERPSIPEDIWVEITSAVERAGLSGEVYVRVSGGEV
jgi:hypothetical protein